MMGGNFNDWKGLDWQNVKAYGGIVEAYRDLIALRRNVQGLSNGLTGRSLNLFHVNEQDKVIAFHRWQNGGSKDDVVIIINFGNRSFTDCTIGFPCNGKWHVRFSSSSRKYSRDFDGTHVPDIEVQSGSGRFVLPASTALIFSQG